ncbi:type VI secretion system baseplate subunit TssF [Capnocytophaga genosp. AHN8471]|uniref:Type VI secretion system baseplate subunit TssF n=1 Tax=Capnocytophaga genosp. AHN8471 TaxID=327574 RepID=A0ABS1YZX3_9FLAO|nr:type VI secretion system baseplate subunit TssF [Capnocytophaga genosp. AHN8471]MBM0651967.1 type VI secretion system baseplate subunit TssF [Capnocytophaga genosp. AHN8471]MBM0663392.1 type VI secretion system baseplate subunit TssF [Capnocytophaga genosp. AHN8471]
MNQEQIKNRMIKRASRMWGYSELESESSFDPVLELLLSACASELEKLRFEQENSRARITDRILEIIFPNQIVGVVPSQTLLQLTPVENNVQLSRYNHFKAIKKTQNIYDPTQVNTKDIYFSPTLEMKLTTAQVKYLLYGNKVFQQESFFYQEEIARSERNIPSGEFWIGIHAPGVEKLEDLCFYIDVNNKEQKEFFTYYLQQVKVFSEGKEYELVEGYNTPTNSIEYENIISKNYTGIDAIYNEVNQFYQANFFTLKGTIYPKTEEEKSVATTLLENYFLDHKFITEKDIIWLQFKFYEVITPKVLENVRIALNCVPAINIRNTEDYKRIKGQLTIYPITGEDSFLDIDYISDNYKKRYDVKNYLSDDNISIVLRRGGVARFDERNALEHLQHLLGLIREETASFSAIGNDFAIEEELKQIGQNLASIYQNIKEKNLSLNPNPYLIFSSNNKEMDMNFTISYWHTAAEEGNDIKTGISLVCDSENKTAISKAIVVKPSFGGRRGLTTSDKILEYRNALLSRGRIVTIADVKTFAKSHFKHTIKGLEVQKGTKKEVSLKGGFKRTIDIYLNKNKEVEVSETEWEYLKDSFLIKLEKASTNIYPYRIFEK